jgi:hypothetical protein
MAYLPTLWSLEVDNGVVILEHVNFIDVLKRLNAYRKIKVKM